MNGNLKIVLKCLGFTIITFLAVNLIYFAFELANTNLNGNWSLGFDNGNFLIKESPTGLIFGSLRANSFLLLAFAFFLFLNFTNGNFNIKK